MHVIQVRTRGAPATAYTGIAFAGFVGAVFLGIGLAAAYIALTTPLVVELSRLGQGRIGSLAGALVFALAILIPGTFVVIGIARLVAAVERSLALLPPRERPVAAMANRLPDHYAVIEGVRLPDRRVIPEVVVGPAGLLVVEELPPAHATRNRGHFWEVRLATGRWRHIENPIERAARDAARLQNWLRSEGEDLSPRMYAAVVTDGHTLERTNEVAVLTREQIPAFLAAMPPIHYMTPEHRTRLTEILQQAI